MLFIDLEVVKKQKCMVLPGLILAFFFHIQKILIFINQLNLVLIVNLVLYFLIKKDKEKQPKIDFLKFIIS